MGSNPWLKVNLNGERYHEVRPVRLHPERALTQPNHTVVDIWDSDCSETYLEQFDIHVAARACTRSKTLRPRT